MKKAGIVTFQYNNYGTKLQNFAMVFALNKIGIEPVSIYIKYRRDTYRSIIRDIIKYPLKVVLTKRSVFSRFSRKHLKRRGVTYKGLKQINTEFDFFIAGSDQIWNPAHLLTRPKDKGLFFLKFADRNKRVAYAPSFGANEIDEENLKIYRKNLKGFAHLSIREPVGQKIISRVTGKSVPIIPDPTFLLDKDDWRSVTEPYDKKYAGQRFIVVYFLSQQNDQVNQQISEYAEANSLSIIRIAGDAYIDKDSIIPGPDEFISLVVNAQTLFTDSFHGAVFSIIMGVPFVVYKRTDVKQHSRIDNLLNTFNLELASYNPKRQLGDMINGLDFSHVDTTLIRLKRAGTDYLKSALGTKEAK